MGLNTATFKSTTHKHTPNTVVDEESSIERFCTGISDTTVSSCDDLQPQTMSATRKNVNMKHMTDTNSNYCVPVHKPFKTKYTTDKVRRTTHKTDRDNDTTERWRAAVSALAVGVDVERRSHRDTDNLVSLDMSQSVTKSGRHNLALDDCDWEEAV